MSHTPWTKEDAEKWAKECQIEPLGMSAVGKANLRLGFLAGMAKAAEMIEKCETVHGGENNMGTLSWSPSRMNDDTYSAKLVGVRPIADSDERESGR